MGACLVVMCDRVAFMIAKFTMSVLSSGEDVGAPGERRRLWMKRRSLDWVHRLNAACAVAG